MRAHHSSSPRQRSGAPLPGIGNAATLRRAVLFLLLAALGSCDRCGTEPEPEVFDLAVAVTDTPDPVIAGGAIVYTVVVTNAGPEPATDVSVEIKYSGPATQSAQPGPVTNGTCSGVPSTTVRCKIERLGVGLAAEFVITAAAPGAAGQVSVQVELEKSTDTGVLTLDDLDDSNNQVTETTTVFAPQLGIAVVKRVNPSIIELGAGQVSYSIDITVTGDVPVNRLDITDNVPPALVVDGPSVAPPPCAVQGNTITCAIIRTSDPLTRGAGMSVTYRVTPAQTGEFSNTATVTANGTLMVPATAFVTVTPPPPPTFTVTKRSNPASIELGRGDVTYDLVIQNTGTTPITSLAINDAVPQSFTVASTGPNCALQPGNVVTCALDLSANPLVKDASLTHTIGRATPTQTGTFTNAVSVTANGLTTVQASVQTTVLPPPAFTLVKRSQPATIALGSGDVTYVVDVQNTGDTPITHLEISDAVPAGLTAAVVPGSACVLQAGNVVKCTLDLSGNPIAKDATRTYTVASATPTQAGSFTNNVTATANGTTQVQASVNTTVTGASAVTEEAVAINFARVVVFAVEPNGSLTPRFDITSPNGQGASEGKALKQPAGAGGPASSIASATAPATTAVFISYITSKSLIRWNVGADGGFTEAASYAFAEAPFQLDVNRQGSCVAVPLQSGARIQMLTTALAATSQLQIPGGFPTKVLFHPLHDVAYAADGTKVHVLGTNPGACSLTDTGSPLTFNNRRDVAIDPAGDFLHVLTYNPFGGATAIALQRLTNGLPAGGPVTTPLPAAAFLVEPHPTLDVLYVLQDAPSSAIRKLTFDRAAGVVTVGNAVSAPGVDEVAFNADASRLYYTNVSSPSLARICWFDLNAQGDLLGTPTCSSDPTRGIDSDLLLITPPAAAPASPRVRR